MNFVRGGPRYLFLKTENPQFFYQKLKQKFEIENLDFQSAIQLATEESVIVFLGDFKNKKLKVEHSNFILYLNLSATAFMVEILNNKYLTNELIKITAGPGQLVVRVPKNGEKIIEEIKANYQAEKLSILAGINKGNPESTIISFSEDPIKSKLQSLNKVVNNILVNKNTTLIFEELRRDVIRYITHGLQAHQWSELKINIYDSDELYELEYKRLITILSDLEAGIILGESWTKDHAFALFSITAYQIRIFTFLSALEIKKILFAFEYNNEGQRLVDYDLFQQNNKISWSQILNDNQRYNRKELAFKFRKEILEKLSESAKAKYFNLEAKIKEKSELIN